MLLLGIIALVITIPLASHFLSTILIHGLTLPIFLYGSLFTDTGIEISEGLVHSYTIFVPIMTYSNANSDKSRILSEHKGQAGIYMWTHIKSSKRYIGSSRHSIYQSD